MTTHALEHARFEAARAHRQYKSILTIGWLLVS
jgi:hypothetical protein